MLLVVAISWGCKMIPCLIASIEIYCSTSLLSAYRGCLTWSSKHPKPSPVLHWFCMAAATSSILHKEPLLCLLNWHVTLYKIKPAPLWRQIVLLQVDYTKIKKQNNSKHCAQPGVLLAPMKTIHGGARLRSMFQEAMLFIVSGARIFRVVMHLAAFQFWRSMMVPTISF